MYILFLRYLDSYFVFQAIFKSSGEMLDPLIFLNYFQCKNNIYMCV